LAVASNNLWSKLG